MNIVKKYRQVLQYTFFIAFYCLSTIAHLHASSVDSLCAKAQDAYISHDSTAWLSLSKSIAALPEVQSNPLGKAVSHFLLGLHLHAQSNFDDAQEQYIEANYFIKKEGAPFWQYVSNLELGKLYFEWEAYQQADIYLTAATKNLALQRAEMRAIGFYYLARNAFQQGDFQDAILSQKQYLTTIKNSDATSYWQGVQFLEKCYSSEEKFEEAKQLLQQEIAHWQDKGDGTQLADAYNRMGLFKDSYLKDWSGAAVDYQKAIETEKMYANNSDLIALYSLNYGAVSFKLRAYEPAEQAMDNAYHLYKLQDEKSEQLGIIENFRAAGALIGGRNEVAILHAEKSLELLENTSLDSEKAVSYQIIADAFKREEEFKLSQEYDNKLDILTSQREEEYFDEQKRLTEQQLAVERKEQYLLNALSEKEKQALALKQLQLEGAQKKQELALLKQQKQLQEANLKSEQLEKQRVAQALALANEQLAAEQKEKEIAALQQKQALQDMAFKRKELEEQEKARAIELLEAEKVIQAKELEQQAASQKYFMIGLIVSGLFIVLVLTMFIFRGRANRLLKKQQYEITEKNEELQASEEELRQNMEELQATQELLAEQKQVLQVQFQKVTHSINYAETIQNAILPHITVREKLFPENFLIYKPKDIVSGDFYWLSEQDGNKLASVIDCTGHGVPGAFMSMIGHNILTEITEQMGIYDPAAILNILHKQVREKLNQKEGANNDGMDIGICRFQEIDKDKTLLTYAGAKHILFYIKEGNVLALKSDRKSIGGKHADDDIAFTNQELELSRNDKVYLTSDGFLDQAGKDRKSFTSKRFIELIQNHYQKPLYEQKLIFENALEEHQQKAEQRDDITVLAMSI